MYGDTWHSATRSVVAYAKEKPILCGVGFSFATCALLILVATFESSLNDAERRSQESSEAQHLTTLLPHTDQEAISGDLLEIQHAKQRRQAAKQAQARLNSCRQIYFGSMFQFQQCAERAKATGANVTVLCGADFMEFNSALVLAKAQGCDVSSIDGL